MRAMIPCMLLALLLAACGGGNTPDNTAAEEPFIPDFTTPEGATLAFERAIETHNLTLIEQLAQPQEREEMLKHFGGNMEQSKKAELKWRIEFEERQYTSDTEVIALAKYFRIKGGSEAMDHQGWVVFIQVEDGTWKYALEKARHLNKIYRGEIDPNEKPPEDKPPEDKPPEDKPPEE